MGGSGPFNPFFKISLGFLHAPDGDVAVASASGQYRIFDHTEGEADKPATRARALLVPITGSSTFHRNIVFSLRHDGGTDGGSGRSDWNRNALELHTGYVGPGSNSGSHFLDTTPGSAIGTEDRDDGGLLIGRTYSESADLNGTSLHGALHVTPIARGSIIDGGITHQYMDVTVNLGDFPSNRPPSATLAASSTGAGVGETVTFTTTATDPDGDPLAYSFLFGDGSYGYENSPTASHSFSTPGLYEVTVTVSDTRGGTVTASRWINVGNQPVYDALASPPATVAGLDYRYYEQAFTALPDFSQLLPHSGGTTGSVSISPRLRNDDFAFLYEGFISTPADDIYTFYLRSEDGSSFRISGQLLIDNDGQRSSAEIASASIALKAGLHPVRIEFFHGGGAEELSLQWRSTATANRIVSVDPASLSRPDPAANTPPAVTITSPADTTSFTLGDPITLSATASDPDGIARVAWFAGNLYLGESSTPPFQVTWDSASIGTHAITALAHDNAGFHTRAADISITVAPSEQRRMISLNFFGKADNSEATLAPTDEIGAVYPGANWNNLDSNEKKGINGTILDLKDNEGTVQATDVTWYTASSDQFAKGESTADITTPAGKMMRGLLDGRADQAGPTITVSDIPYAGYDVFVYFEGLESANNSTRVHKFDLTPATGPAPADIYGMNARLENGSSANKPTVFDYPSYADFSGFRESTATAVGDAETDETHIQKLLGNYVVFRAQTSTGFVLHGDHTNTSLNYPGIAGVQIVEIPAPTLSPIDRWRLATFGTSENTGTAADSHDANSNGRANLLEFAQATDAKNDTGPHHPVKALRNGTDAEFHFRWRKGDHGLTRRIWKSETLSTDSWSEITTPPAIIPGAGDADADVLKVTIPSSPEKMFFRLEVSR